MGICATGGAGIMGGCTGGNGVNTVSFPPGVSPGYVLGTAKFVLRIPASFRL
jgi:hypothetical protein